jgi:hypothetical protein
MVKKLSKEDEDEEENFDYRSCVFVVVFVTCFMFPIFFFKK